MSCRFLGIFDVLRWIRARCHDKLLSASANTLSFTRRSYNLCASVRWQSFAICTISTFKAFLSFSIVTLTTRLLFYYWARLFSQRSKTVTTVLMDYNSPTSNSFELKMFQDVFPFSIYCLLSLLPFYVKLEQLNVNKWPKWATEYLRRDWALVG